MSRPASENPTELELQLLKILWTKSPRPVREIREVLAQQGRDIAHTSVITTLNTMVEKKFLKRKKQGKRFLFEPKVTREKMSWRILKKMVERVFDGSTKAVLLSLFDDSDIDVSELQELKQLIDQKVKKAKS